MMVWRGVQRVKAWWRRWPSWLRAACTTAGQVLAGVVLLSTLRVLDQARLWADGGMPPDLGVWWRDLADASFVFFAALAAAVHRRLRPPEQAYNRKGLEQ